jgi:CheY-like chemotaxis protein
MILEEQGFLVTTSNCAEDAWEVFQKSRFDVVVTDYRLKGMNGGELIRLIRASDSAARVILLSGFIGILGLNEENTGADELILKSSKEVPELVRAVRKFCQQAPRRRPPVVATGSVTGKSKPLTAKLVSRKTAGNC